MNPEVFVQSPAIESQPEDHAVVWRYMDLARFLSCLEDGAIHLARVDQMRDKWEGSFTEANVASWPEKFADYGSGHFDVIAKLARGSAGKMFMSCWHVSTVESAAMWDIYQREGRAVAICSTWGQLKTQVGAAPNVHIYGGLVQYIDYRTRAIPDDNVLSPFMYKRESFAHEREARLITIANTYDPADAVPEEERINDFEPGTVIALKTDLSAAINSVFIAPGSQEWFGALVQKIVARYGYTFPVLQSDLERGPIT